MARRQSQLSKMCPWGFFIHQRQQPRWRLNFAIETSVVKSLPVPPSVYISLAIFSPVIYRPGDAITIFKISVTNTANQPVTRVSVGSQPYVLSDHAQSNNHACVIDTSANISPGNFSMTHVASRKEVVQKSCLCFFAIQLAAPTAHDARASCAIGAKDWILEKCDCNSTEDGA